MLNLSRRSFIKGLCAIVASFALCSSVADATLVSSGETSISTSTDAAVTVLAANSQSFLNQVVLVNEGIAGGFFSLDNFTTPGARIPPGPSSIVINIRELPQGLKVKRTTGGTNLSGIYAWIN